MISIAPATDWDAVLNTGQNSQNLDSVFTGNILGHKSDIADGSLRAWEFRTFENLVGDYYISPRFLDAVAVRPLPSEIFFTRPDYVLLSKAQASLVAVVQLHVVKNFLMDAGCFDETTRVPLILGIWGGKGQGKSFQTELAFKKLG